MLKFIINLFRKKKPMTIKDTIVALVAKMEDFTAKVEALEAKIASITVTDVSAIVAEAKAEVEALKAETVATPPVAETVVGA